MFRRACVQLRRRIFHEIHGTDGGQSVICTTKQKKSGEIEQNQLKWLEKKTVAFRKRAIYIGRSICQIDYILSKGNQSWGTHFRATSECRSCKKKFLFVE